MSVAAIGAIGASSNATTAPVGPSIDRRVQSAFTAVLEAAGREGYASAQALASGEPLVESAQQALDEWFGVERTGRYATKESLDDLAKDFEDLVARAVTEGGYTDPKGFLAGLTREELATLQSVQWLAEPIDVAGLTEEGALNLLLPPVAQVDLNRDGLTQSGAALGIRFPNSDTPLEVVDAWDAATAGMPLKERMTYELQMMLPLLTANIVLDSNGAFVHRYEPGDPEFTNPMARDDYSYREAVRDLLAGLEFNKQRMSAQQYEQQAEFWNRLGGELDARRSE